MILIDTGFLIALAHPADFVHSRAIEWADTISEPLLVTEYVLVETLNALSKRTDRFRGQRLIDTIQQHPGYSVVPASPELFSSGFALHCSRADKDWSLTDCISFHLMKEQKITRALAHDEHFEQAGFVALLRHEPPFS